MKQLFFIAVIFTALSSSCGSHNADGESNSSVAESQSASTNSAANVTFSYSLDGTRVSGGAVDELQLNNVAEIYTPPSDPNEKQLRFSLNDGEGKNTDVVAHSLLFTIPYKTGALDLTPDQQTNWFINLFLPSGQADGSRLAYGEETLHVTITNISSTRVSGTFSGTMKKSEADKSSAKDKVTITDGKFDIPIKNVHG